MQKYYLGHVLLCFLLFVSLLTHAQEVGTSHQNITTTVTPSQEPTPATLTPSTTLTVPTEESVLPATTLAVPTEESVLPAEESIPAESPTGEIPTGENTTGEMHTTDVHYTALALPEGVLASGSDPERVADEAIANWQARANASPLRDFNFGAYLDEEDPQAGVEAMCREFSVLGNNPDVISDFVINLESRKLLEESAEGTRRVYSYAANVKDSSVLARVQVRLQKNAKSEGATPWQAVLIQSEYEGLNTGLPDFLTHPLAPWLFSLLSLYVLFLLLRPSWYRRWLAQGMQHIRQHPIVTIVAIVLLYGSYILGTASGVNLPTCQAGLINVVQSSLSNSGIIDAIDGGNVASAATVIASWNFVQGAVVTTFSPALLFGIPAYLVNFARFFMLGFALAPTADVLPLFMWHIPVIIIELLAYILVTAGGGMVLVTVLREGMRAFGLGVRKLLSMLPIAFLLLLIGAWYEALEILVIIPSLYGN